MAYIGNQPALSYTSFAKQDFTTSATTSYTLDNPVTNANELALFINFVRQEPTAGYSASGTTLTLTEATSSSDDMYCVYLGKAVQTVNPPNASVGTSQLVDGTVTAAKILDANVSLAKLSATGTKDATTFLRGDNTFASAGGTNTPAFSAYITADQTSLADDTWVKLAMNAEFYDTDSKYDTGSYRFTPTVAGKYMFGCSVYVNATDTMSTGLIAFYKNGSRLLYTGTDLDNDNKFQLTGVIDLDADDYVELYGYVDVVSAGTWQVNMDGTTSNNRTYWYGYKIIT